jgi:hypothetical protein
MLMLKKSHPMGHSPAEKFTFREQPMLSQEDLNHFIHSYNSDYHFLLTRASMGSYDCLISAFHVLKDLHDFVEILQKQSELELEVTPYSLTFRNRDTHLRELGFNEDQIAKIYGFLDYVQKTQGREFEEVIEKNIRVMCGVANA